MATEDPGGPCVIIEPAEAAEEALTPNAKQIRAVGRKRYRSYPAKNQDQFGDHGYFLDEPGGRGKGKHSIAEDWQRVRWPKPEARRETREHRFM